MGNSIRLAVAAVVLGVSLVGCSGSTQEPDQQRSELSPSAPASAISTPSSSPSEAASTPGVEAVPEPAETEEPVVEVAPPTIPDDDGITTTLAEFVDRGGVCNSDHFPAGPATESALVEIQAYCAEFFPVSGGDYQRPAPDANGYVGPSKEYYSYDGYVAPGFEYQVGSPCFDPALGRCKSSGEIQLEWLNGQASQDG